MGNLAISVLVILLQSLMLNACSSCLNQNSSDNILRDSSPFPSDFLFGTASSAYQYEGAFLTEGKGLNNWDIFTHQYPGSALPRFSRKETEKVKESRPDFVGINHYTSYFIQDCLVTSCNIGDGASKEEGYALKLDRKGNVTIGELTDVKWQHIHPEGFRKMLNYLKDRYQNIPMFITENGFGDLQKPETTINELLNDTKRIQYMSGYLDALQSAMRDGANVKGYFAWSLLDNFEWLYGYRLRFGLYHVDPVTLKRTPKRSASWYKNYIGENIRRRRDTVNILIDTFITLDLYLGIQCLFSHYIVSFFMCKSL